MKICLLTNEIYPVHRGGIGRLMHNFCMQNAADGFPVEMHFLMGAAEPEELATLRAHFDGKAVIHVCPEPETSADPVARAMAGDAAYPGEYAAHYRVAHAYHLGLLQAEAETGGPFDLVEVPDYGGWGQVILQARDAGLAHRGTAVSCRLHSSNGLVIRAERYAHQPSLWFSGQFDLERACIAGADLIVGHVPAVIEANRDHYGFGADWMARTRAEFPPILLDTAIEPSPGTPSEPDFVFSSRLQPFKRPDIFVRGAIAFFERHPRYRGVARVLSYGWDELYIDYLQSLVPETLLDKVVFQFDYTGAERDEILARSVVVIPSNYESLCLFAFEAAQMQRPIILARDCAAFGQSERWVEDENCLMFDGSYADLARAMERAVEWRPVTHASAAHDRPYWADGAASAPAGYGTAAPEIPVLRYGVETEYDLNSVLLQHRAPRGGGGPLHVLVPPALMPGRSTEERVGRNLTLHRVSSAELSPSQVQEVALSLGAPHVLIAHVDYALRPEFLEQGSAAVAHAPEVDLFTGHVQIQDPEKRAPGGITLATGGAPGFAMVENTAAPPAAIVSARAIRETGFDPMARSFWFEVFARKLALAGRRFLVAPHLLLDLEADTNTVANTRKLSGAVADEEGIAHGLPARLMGAGLRIDEHMPRARNTLSLGMQEFHRAVCVWPDPNPRDFELVGIRAHLGGLLTHPLRDGIVTIADMRQELKVPTQRVRLAVTNASDENEGVEFRVVVARKELDRGALKKVAAGKLPRGAVATPWLTVAPGKSSTRMLPLRTPRKGRCYLLSRLPETTNRDAYCWAIWKSVAFIA